MRKEWEKQGAEWQKQAGKWQELAKRQQALALAFADKAPEVSTDCAQAGGSMTRSWTDNDGRQHIVICEREIRNTERMAETQARMGKMHAKMGLRQARGAIAANDGMSASVKQEVLADLDREIARLDAEN
jgi:hypothetical protein